jgi:hypothetical protein
MASTSNDPLLSAMVELLLQRSLGDQDVDLNESDEHEQSQSQSQSQSSLPDFATFCIWAGLLVIALLWCAGALRSCLWQGQRVRQLEGQQLEAARSKQAIFDERRKALIKLFETTKVQMVR